MPDQSAPPGRHLPRAPTSAWDLLASARPVASGVPSARWVAGSPPDARESGDDGEDGIAAEKQPEPPGTRSSAERRADRDPLRDFPPLRDPGDGGPSRWRAGVRRLREDLVDHLPITGQRVTAGLGRYWWLPVVVAIAALALAVGAVVRARPATAEAASTAGRVVATAGTATGGGSGTDPASTGPDPSRTATGVPAAPGSTPSGSVSAVPGSAVVPAVAPAPGEAAAPSTAATSTATPAPTAGRPADVEVDVAGRVHRPGVVTLPAGARIVDAVRAAGGALAGTDLTALDLAQPLTDGAQIRVGLRGPPVVGPTVPAAPGSTVDGSAGGAAQPATTVAAPTVDVNTATAEQLDALPGIGPVLAQRIVDWRTAHGPFASVDDLDEVSGIGAATLAKFRSQLTLGP